MWYTRTKQYCYLLFACLISFLAFFIVLGEITIFLDYNLSIFGYLLKLNTSYYYIVVPHPILYKPKGDGGNPADGYLVHLQLRTVPTVDRRLLCPKQATPNWQSQHHFRHHVKTIKRNFTRISFPLTYNFLLMIKNESCNFSQVFSLNRSSEISVLSPWSVLSTSFSLHSSFS